MSSFDVPILQAVAEGLWGEDHMKGVHQFSPPLREVGLRSIESQTQRYSGFPHL
jgi:hypothetical protein